ncbi:MAG: RtcB family protein [Clostridiales bacterium]|nr:RtcB family protein [Clostridiales bacterium]
MIEFNNIKIFTDDIEQSALEQLKTLDGTGVFDGQPIRIMPDVHTGIGCVIGFTAPIKDKIIPNLVGVDIGCGMLCVSLGKMDIDLSELDGIIRKTIPSGRTVGERSEEAAQLIAQLDCKNRLSKFDWLESSLGTLGGGNHFIEVDEDGNGEKYLIIHSGSRNLGKQVAEYYQDLAVSELNYSDITRVIEELKSQGRDKEISAALKALERNPKLPKHLCYLQGESMRHYLHDMAVCTEFANKNRYTMSQRIINALFGKSADDFYSFTTRHNYIGEDNYIRKGAISAKKGERVLIPLNMRDGCIVGIGKGNPDWNYSAPHGAGRIMSRAKAREQIKIEDFKNTMLGIYSTTVGAETLDEAPFAYKPSEEIISLVKDTVKIEKIIKPIYNYKSGE